MATELSQSTSSEILDELLDQFAMGLISIDELWQSLEERLSDISMSDVEVEVGI